MARDATAAAHCRGALKAAAPAAPAGYYTHWGNYTGPWYNLGSVSRPEPNNFEDPPEDCVAADYLERFKNANATDGEGWGWNDVNCNNNYAFICRYKPGEMLAA